MIERIGWRGWALVAIWNVAMAAVAVVGKPPAWCTWCVLPGWFLSVLAVVGAGAALMAAREGYHELGVGPETEL